MLHKSIVAFAALSALAGPARAAFQQSSMTDVRPGAFVGARLHVPLGGNERARPRASLSIAPASSHISSGGHVRTRIGEGVALNFIPSSRPTVTIAGLRADAAFGLQPGGQADAKNKMGVSTGGWVAIGVGVAALIGGIYFVHLVHEADENSD